MGLSIDLIQPYQFRWAEFCYEHPYCAGWIDMGLGKTVGTLMGLQDMYDDFEAAHTLIVAPTRVARKVWTDEMHIWDHIREFDVQKIIRVPGDTGKQNEARCLKAMNTKAEIHIINRENVKWLIDQHVDGRRLIRKWHWDTVILDESTSFSYQSSQRWKALRLMRKKMNRVIELTGAPDTRNMRGLWAQAYLLDQGKRLGFSEKAYLDRWFIAPSRHDPGNRYEPRSFAQKQIQKRLQDIVLTLRAKDYLDIEDPWPIWHTVGLTRSERAVYDDMQKNFILEYGGEVITAVNAGVLANKLLQLSNGFIYDSEKNWHPFHERKTEALLEIIEAAQGPVMIAYNYIPDRIRIERALTKAKLNWRLLKTEKDEDDWNAGKYDVLVLSPGSAGEGTNLYKNGCSNLVWYGLIWSLYQYQQTCARLTGGHRAVGKQIQLHHIITEGTYEDRVRLTLARNAKNQDEMKAGLAEYVGKAVQ
jgi:SNF2 family DNA or RNA helicase